jgi:hypothetical protein
VVAPASIDGGARPVRRYNAINPKPANEAAMMSRPTLPMLFALLVLPALLVAGCAGSKAEKTLDLTLSEYEKTIRWSQWDQAIEFLSPDYQEENPVTRLDIDRLRLFRVTRYEIRSALPLDEGLSFRQTVEIGLFHKSRAVERSIIDTQEWRYDEESQSWFLHSGLPDVTRAR